MTAKYRASDGHLLWAEKDSGVGATGWDVSSEVEVDERGNVYVAGRSETVTGADILVLKYDADGTVRWRRRFSWIGYVYHEVKAMEYACGRLALLARAEGPSGAEFLTIAIDSADGDTAWVKRYQYPGRTDNRPSDLACDAAGGVYVTGTVTVPPGYTTYYTAMYDRDGNQAWAMVHDDTSRVDSESRGLCASADWCVVTGSRGAGSTSDFMTIKYAYDVGVKSPPSARLPVLPRSGSVDAGAEQIAAGTAFDVTGRRVTARANGTSTGNQLPPGVYFLRQGGNICTAKVVVASK